MLKWPGNWLYKVILTIFLTSNTDNVSIQSVCNLQLWLCRRELGHIFLHPQIRYLCSNILETGHIRSFWSYFGQVSLVIYLYNRLVLCCYDFGRRELGYMFLECQIWYLCINDLETGHIRSFWPHFWWARLVRYLYSRYTPWRYHFGPGNLSMGTDFKALETYCQFFFCQN